MKRILATVTAALAVVAMQATAASAAVNNWPY